MKEIFKQIKGFEGLYEISNLGRVKSFYNNKYGLTNKGRFLKPGVDGAGYKLVVLYKNKIQRSYAIHRLISEAFIQNPLNKPCINHKNGIKTDNKLENLEWCTYSENNKHAVKIGLRKYANKKLFPKQVRIIKYALQYNVPGIKKVLAKMFNVRLGTIYKINNNRTYKYIII